MNHVHKNGSVDLGVLGLGLRAIPTMENGNLVGKMKMEIGRINRYIQSAMVIPRYPKP